ncbi:hypothetical protein BMW26_14540 [Microbacterium sp. 1.5R]|uniref:fumarylacetoacetate hydrolase family protein n=1 Tax=Microbacterium sp. 1.5R TaxID=1916917 RepID=UPI000909AF7D|nr:fumarylacetoacetate hydrolase family protein [Microbacterium sp. 1.5R]APH46039.1 hypothetical protein BMW26_14540 [Microbacterium sp. 1.5R]
MSLDEVKAGPFGIGTFEVDGATIPAAVRGSKLFDLRDVIPGLSVTSQLFEDWDRNLDRIDDHLRAASTQGIVLDHGLVDARLRVLPPVQPVGPVIAAGANYREHIIEMSVAHRLGRDDASDDELRAEAAHEIDERVRAGDPYIWTGIPSAVVGAYDDVQLPDVGEDVDWELELGVVLRRDAYRIAAEDAWDHIAGFTIVNDLTARSLVPRPDMAKIGTDWFRSKNQPTFFPTGPVLMPSRFVTDPGSLRLELRLNGDVMQDATTGGLAFDVPSLLSYASSVAQLRAGDLLITGSPAGNGSHWKRFLRDGDVMEGSITGLGFQRNAVRGPTGHLPPWQASRPVAVSI